MNIELKNFKHFSSLSEETEAFTATVYVDGVRLFTAENTGKGEAHKLMPVDGKSYADIDKVAQWVKSLPEVELGSGQKTSDDLDFYIARLVDQKVDELSFKRLLKNRVILFDSHAKTHGLVQLKSKFKPSMIHKLRANIYNVYPDCIIINELPFEQGIKFYRASSSKDKLQELYLQLKKAA